jgi:hypothetical protein
MNLEPGKFYIHKYAGWYAMTHWSDRTTALCGETIINKNQRWRWAREFIKKFPDFDLDTARAWFCSAIMAGWDHAHWAIEKERIVE